MFHVKHFFIEMHIYKCYNENNKEGKLKNLFDNFYYKEDIDSIVNEIEKLLNCG